MKEFLAEWCNAKGEDVRIRMVANHYAWETLETISNMSIWDWLDRYAKCEDLKATYQLLYALSATHRLRAGEIPYPEFLLLIPDDDKAFAELRVKLLQVLSSAFFWPTLLKMSWEVVNHHLETRRKRENEWIGSSGNTGPSKLESPSPNIDTSLVTQS